MDWGVDTRMWSPSARRAPRAAPCRADRVLRRMLGASDAEDSVQETFIRAWRGFEGFEGRAPLRSWLYRIARNVCIDTLEARQRRARPIDLSSAGEPSAHAGMPGAGTPLRPVLIDCAADGHPEEAVLARESVRLALVVALQHLPPRQRAVLILREVLRWRAAEVAGLSTRAWPPSTAPSSVRGQHSRHGRRAHQAPHQRTVRRAPNFSAAMSMPSSATTWRRSCRCCKRTRLAPPIRPSARTTPLSAGAERISQRRGARLGGRAPFSVRCWGPRSSAGNASRLPPRPCRSSRTLSSAQRSPTMWMACATGHTDRTAWPRRLRSPGSWFGLFAVRREDLAQPEAKRGSCSSRRSSSTRPHSGLHE